MKTAGCSRGYVLLFVCGAVQWFRYSWDSAGGRWDCQGWVCHRRRVQLLLIRLTTTRRMHFAMFDCAVAADAEKFSTSSLAGELCTILINDDNKLELVTFNRVMNLLSRSEVSIKSSDLLCYHSIAESLSIALNSVILLDHTKADIGGTCILWVQFHNDLIVF